MTTPDAATVETWAKELWRTAGGLTAAWDRLEERERSHWRTLAHAALTLYAQAVAAALVVRDEILNQWIADVTRRLQLELDVQRVKHGVPSTKLIQLVEDGERLLRARDPHGETA